MICMYSYVTFSSIGPQLLVEPLTSGQIQGVFATLPFVERSRGGQTVMKTGALGNTSAGKSTRRMISCCTKTGITMETTMSSTVPAVDKGGC